MLLKARGEYDSFVNGRVGGRWNALAVHRDAPSSRQVVVAMTDKSTAYLVVGVNEGLLLLRTADAILKYFLCCRADEGTASL